MLRTVNFCLLGLVLAGLGAVEANPPKQSDDLQELSKTLKPLLADIIPPVIYEKSENWGNTRRVPHAVEWHGLRPEVHKTPRNDGTWRKLKVSVRNPKQTVDILMWDLRRHKDDRQTFKTHITFGCNVEYHQQNWESGIRLWSGSVRARFRVHAQLDCENIMRTETKPDAILPDIVFRLRVTKAKVAYDDLVVEHVAGIGGTAARVIGDTFHDAMNQWRPSIERNLLDRAGAAIVKAGDTKEVRIGLSGLFKEKK